MSTNPDEEGPDQLSTEKRKAINEYLMKFADEEGLQPDMVRKVPIAGALLLQVLAQRGAIDARYRDFNLAKTSVREKPRLAELLADALVKKDFSSVCRLQLLRPTGTVQQSAKDASMWLVVNEQKRQAVRDAWTSPYVGDAHTTLLENVREINSSRGMNPYANSMPLLQSSGMGKSRTVDELAKDIFVIPLNVRREATGYPFPHSDPDIYDYLVSANYYTWEVTMLAYYNFFFHLFSGIREEIRTHLKGPYPSQKELAQAWRTHLAPVNSQEDRRMTLYSQMMRDATKSFYSEKRGQTSTQDAAEGRGLELAEAIKELAPISPGGLVMVLYVDEAHTLTDAAIDTSQNIPRNRYSVLTNVLSEMHILPIFTLFLSTNSHLYTLSPSREVHHSLRFKEKDDVPAPYNEMPWDVFSSGKVLVREGEKSLDDVCSFAFMCNFGRPLWRALYANATKDVRATLMAVVITKLTGIYDFTGVHNDALRDLLDDACLAALSVRLLLEYLPINEDIMHTGVRLVESHLAVVYTISKDRKYLTAGYPSEPVVAEAAAQVMRRFQDPVPDILARYTRSAMISAGQRGELVMRLLLIRAFDNASKRNRGDNDQIDRPVSLFAFLEELFNVGQVNKLRVSYPASGYGERFDAAFKDAHVRFTHFARLEDNSLVTSRGAWIAMTRGIAWQCAPQQEVIDCIVPVALNRGLLSEKTMTAILIQVKNRKSPAPLVIDESKLSHKGHRFFPAETEDRRPYIALVLELGVRNVRSIGKSHHPSPDTHSTPSKVSNLREKPPSVRLSESSNAPMHPRYQLDVYGCSPRVYSVVKDKKAYTLLLDGRDIYLEHPRRSTEPWLKRVRGYWSAKTADWTDDSGKAQGIDEDIEDDQTYLGASQIHGESISVVGEES